MESVSGKLNALQNVTRTLKPINESCSSLDIEANLYVNLNSERKSIISGRFTDEKLDKNVSTDFLNKTRSTITNAIDSKNKIIETDRLSQTTYCEMCPCIIEEENECMKRELDILRPKSKEAEMLKLERDRLQIELNDLAHIQVQYENLRLKCCCLESAAYERDIYKKKYDEILLTECECKALKSQIEETKNLTSERDALMKQVADLENNVWKQEGEIKSLMAHIENLTHGKEDIQNSTRDALSAIRGEVNKKDQIIAALQQQVPAVQSQLKKAINRVSLKLTRLKIHIEELEGKLEKSQLENDELKKQVKEKDMHLKGAMQLIKCEYKALAAMNRELDAAQEENNKLQQIANKMIALTSDDNIKKVLKQSECAVNRAVEELKIQYKEWDNLRRNKKKENSAGDGCSRCERCKFESKGVSERKTSPVSIFRCPTAECYNTKHGSECKTSSVSIFKWPTCIFSKFRCPAANNITDDNVEHKASIVSVCRCHKAEFNNKNNSEYKTTTVSKFRCPAAKFKTKDNAQHKPSLVSMFKCPTSAFEDNNFAECKTSLVSIFRCPRVQSTNKDLVDYKTSLVSVLQSRTISKVTLKEELEEIQREKEKLEKLVDRIKNNGLLCGPQPVLYSFKNSLCKFTKIVTEDDTSEK